MNFTQMIGIGVAGNFTGHLATYPLSSHEIDMPNSQDRL